MLNRQFIEGYLGCQDVEYYLSSLWHERALPHEFLRLENVEQEPAFHPEGRALIHSIYVCGAAQKIVARDQLFGDERDVLLLAALCHDVGKYSTTVYKETKHGWRWTAPGHPEAGVPITVDFLRSAGQDETVIEQVASLVAEHMVYLQCQTPRAARRLLARLKAPVDQLVRIIEADHSGRPPLPPGLPEKAVSMKVLLDDLTNQHTKIQ